MSLVHVMLAARGLHAEAALAAGREMNMSEFELAPHHQALKTALAPVLARLHAALAARESARLPCPDMRAEVQWHGARMAEEIQRLDVLVNETLAPAALADGRAEQAERAASALLAWIDAWAARMAEVERLHPAPDERDARDWLAAAYRRTLNELCAGLEALLRILEDPLGELARRGLPTGGEVTLPLAITLTTGPEVDALADWSRRRARRRLPSERETRRQGLGFWGWVGAIALGSWIGSSLADDD